MEFRNSGRPEIRVILSAAKNLAHFKILRCDQDDRVSPGITQLYLGTAHLDIVDVDLSLAGADLDAEIRRR
jgi:hypothetical protein